MRVFYLDPVASCAKISKGLEVSKSFALKVKPSPSKVWTNTLFLAPVKVGFIYLVSLRWPVAVEASEGARC